MVHLAQRVLGGEGRKFPEVICCWMHMSGKGNGGC